MKDLLSIYAPTNRTRMLLLSAFLIAAIAVVDWAVKRYISLGFLYLFPIIIVGGFLSRSQIVVIALLCAAFAEAFGDLPGSEAIVRLILSSAGFVGTGLFVSETVRSRRLALRHVAELEDQVRLREDAEEQLRSLVESSPAAILTIDSDGSVLLVNEGAQQLLAPDGPALQGQPVSRYLPALQTVLKTQRPRTFRTTLQCTGQRQDDEVFLAGVWFSTYRTISGLRLAAIIVDLSEDLRNREDLSLDHLLKNTRILMSAVAHEIRNVSGAVLVVHKNLSRLESLEDNEDFRALGGLLQSLERLSSLELGSAAAQNGEAVELTSVLSEFRIVIENTYHESNIQVRWDVPSRLPLVWADRYGLLQVFLNLAKNSQRAMTSAEIKQLRISAGEENGKVVIRFEDTGVGIASPEKLFQPFQPGAKSSGLGLYVSRAIMRSFGGDIAYEQPPHRANSGRDGNPGSPPCSAGSGNGAPQAAGCCFVVFLPLTVVAPEAVGA